METTRLKSWITGKILRISVLVILAFLAGYILKSATQRPTNSSASEHSNNIAVSQNWTCSMHPEVIQDEPGKCPKCGMDLILLQIDSTVDIDQRELTISQEAARLMEIETSVVQRKFIETEVRMVGKIDYDETLVKDITAWVPGRIDRLYVDFIGITINKGDHMVYLYSPDLISAQAELMQAIKAAKKIDSGTSDLVKRATEATLEAAREKLRLLGLNDAQITDIENAEKPVTHLTIYSPISGIVIHKHATEGMYVKTGTLIYTVADLSRLWVKLDAYESDLPWIRYGQEVEFITEAYPGEFFKGTISFIDPVLNPKTRTVKLRVNVDNNQGKLKPQMFVKAVVHAKVAKGGKVIAPEMAGKSICPMHPDVIKDSAGSCETCGMDLVTTESVGYVKVDEPNEAPLVIPTSAALITGKRAVVYVKKSDTDIPTFDGREVTLGPRAGNHYIVKSGLHEGEIVVTNGNFKIDSAIQIRAKPSMMNPKAEKRSAGHHSHSN